MEEIAEKAEYLLAKPSDDCKLTKMSVKYDFGVRVDIDHLPGDLSCVLQLKNLGNYSSSLNFNPMVYKNIEAHVFETDEERSFFEYRGKFSSLDGDELPKLPNDFHIWYGNTSMVVLTAKDPSKGPAVFRAIIRPLPAPEEDIPHIEEHMKKSYSNVVLFVTIFGGVTVLMYLVCGMAGKRFMQTGDGLEEQVEDFNEGNYAIGSNQLFQQQLGSQNNPILVGSKELREIGYKIIPAIN